MELAGINPAVPDGAGRAKENVLSEAARHCVTPSFRA